MSNGKNCFYWICCPPPAQDAPQEEWDAWELATATELANSFRAAAEAATVRRPETGEVIFGDPYVAMFQALLKNNAVVPREVGLAIARGYVEFWDPAQVRRQPRR